MLVGFLMFIMDGGFADAAGSGRLLFEEVLLLIGTLLLASVLLMLGDGLVVDFLLLVVGRCLLLGGLLLLL